MSRQCEMIHTFPEGEQIECGKTSIGITEGGVRICEECAVDMIAEGFRVDRDPPKPRPVMGARMLAITAISMLAGIPGIEGAFPEMRRRSTPDPVPSRTPVRTSTPARANVKPCPWHDADGRQCELGLKHPDRPWAAHRHADGWKERPESRQVRRARERQASKSKRRQERRQAQR